MIKEKEISIYLGAQNITYYRNKGYECKYGESIMVKIEDLKESCKKQVTAICSCGNEHTMRYEKYITNKSRCGYYGCKKCSTKKRIILNQERYGVDFTTQLPEVREKMSNTNIEKYGVACVFSSKDIQEQIKETNLEKYGVEYALQSKEIRNKGKETCLDKYGVVSYTKTDEFKALMSDYHQNKTEDEKQISLERAMKTCLERYGFTSYSKTYKHREYMGSVGSKPEYIKKRTDNKNLIRIDYYNEIFQDIYKFLTYENTIFTILDLETNDIFEISRNNVYHRVLNNISLNTITHPVDSKQSFKEQQLIDFIKLHTTNVKTRNKTILEGKELDIYLPDFNLGIEFNGLYWHSEVNKTNDYHLNKTILCEERGINLFHIWEDEWLFKRKYVESYILDLLKLNPILTDNFIIKQISKNVAELFHNENNLLGYTNSTFHYGIYIGTELYYVMSFYQRGDVLEITRFTTKLFISLKDSESFMLEFVEQIYNPNKIIFYGERRLLDYKKLNYKIVEYETPDFYLIKNEKRYHKWELNQITDEKLLLNMESLLEHRILRLWDCGKILLESK